MDRARVNHFIDVGMLITFITLFTTGILKFPKLLPLLGVSYAVLPMNQISLLHDWCGVILGVLITIHFLLHWRWMWSMTRGLFRRSK